MIRPHRPSDGGLPLLLGAGTVWAALVLAAMPATAAQPQIDIVAPHDEAVVRGRVRIVVSLIDPPAERLLYIELLLVPDLESQLPIILGRSAQTSWLWNTTEVANGGYTLRALAAFGDDTPLLRDAIHVVVDNVREVDAQPAWRLGATLLIVLAGVGVAAGIGYWEVRRREG